MLEEVKRVDPEIYDALQKERDRQRDGLELIASENFVSEAVLQAMGTAPTNKYAEGYPGKRYYGGCEFVDVMENLARDRCKELFGAAHANVQAHSGSGANMGVYMALLDPGDTILGMDLSHGGHLTHGSPVNFSGSLYKVESYGVERETETLDYDALAKQAREVRPKMLVTGASAYPRELDFERLRAIADEVDAYLLADIAHIAGLIAVGLHPTSIGHAHVTSSTTHKTLRGPRGGLIMADDADLGKKVDKAIFPGIQGGPLMHMIAAKAVAFLEALQPEFKAYQQQILDNAQALAQGLTERGFRLVSGGTDNHLMLIDLNSVDLTGKVAEERLERVHITVNKNTIPFETRSPFVTSGIRLGTPALTSRGMKEAEMDRVADVIHRTLTAAEDDAATLEAVRGDVAELCAHFPLYPDRP